MQKILAPTNSRRMNGRLPQEKMRSAEESSKFSAERIEWI
jgi:hypothetical protein